MPVEDFASLDHEWAAYIALGSVSGGARTTYERRWKIWAAHCKDERVDAWNAPASAFEGLWLLRRGSDGGLLSPGTVEGIAVAVAHLYAQRGLTPAHKLPENRGRWLELRRGARRTASRGVGTESAVVPMMRSDACELLAAPLPALRPIRKAALLLLFHGFPPALIDSLSRDDVTVRDRADSGVLVRNELLACDHKQRVRGVPWDCVACAVRDALPHLGPGRSLNTGLSRDLSALRSRFRHVAGRRSHLGPQQDLTPWELAGLRRAMVLSSSEIQSQAYRWARARASTGVAWSCGLRMGSDIGRIPRAHALPDAAGRGWSVRLGATKDDSSGAKDVVRPFGWEDGNGTVAAVLAEYACVRDALVGDDGYLFVGLGDKTHGKPFRFAASVAKSDLGLLAELAGAKRRFSSYSTRKGYAAQALEDGWTEVQVQEGLRHLHLNTTVSRYLPKAGGGRAVRRFAERLAQEASE